MLEKIFTNLYKLEIPLSQSPLRALNSYIIKTPERNLIIDTGWNHDECMDAMKTGLRELGIDLKITDFFITHLHSDHLGLVSALAPETSNVFFNQPDADRLSAGFRFDDFVNFARLNGFPEDELQLAIQTHPGLRYRSKVHLNFHILKEGDTITIGDYFFKCIQTPGHSWGHMCLYEPHKNILIAGDHILSDITPTIQLWTNEWNPLKKYLTSLEKIEGLDVELVLPGHRSIFKNYKERIQELKSHHQERLHEIISILSKGCQNAFQIASQMSWEIVYDSWELFPITQKWFALGETIAHLKYLEEEKILQKDMEGQKIIYHLSQD